MYSVIHTEIPGRSGLLISQHVHSEPSVEGGRYITHSRLRLKCDGTSVEPRFCLSVKRTSPFKSAAEVCASAAVMLDTPSSEVVKGTGYPFHSPVSPSLPLPASLDATNKNRQWISRHFQLLPIVLSRVSPQKTDRPLLYKSRVPASYCLLIYSKFPKFHSR
jgi:hypothetical protein